MKKTEGKIVGSLAEWRILRMYLFSYYRCAQEEREGGEGGSCTSSEHTTTTHRAY
jgi:hypothetical protein